MKEFSFFVACFFLYLETIHAAGPVNPSCLQKEKALALLETAENLLTKARDSFPSCKEDVNSTNDSECSKKESLAYIEISKKLISDARNNFPKSQDPVEKDDKIALDDKPVDCSEILATGRNESGVYTIWPGELCRTRKPLKVYCDMETDYGGWTMIQRRGKFPVQQDFYQGWESYKNGFGNVSEEFWLGNENIRVLCQDGCEIRFELENVKGLEGYIKYRNFTLSRSNYRISISINGGGGFFIGGSIGDHDTHEFSTFDKGNTEKAVQFKGGWWYRNFANKCNPNGIYQAGNPKERIHWSTWNQNDDIARVEIKVRPK